LLKVTVHRLALSEIAEGGDDIVRAPPGAAERAKAKKEPLARRVASHAVNAIEDVV
jgi:hypothetical protein